MGKRIFSDKGAVCGHYRRPELRIYGTVVSLTASGTGQVTESVSSPGGGCENVSSRVRC